MQMLTYCHVLINMRPIKMLQLSFIIATRFVCQRRYQVALSSLGFCGPFHLKSWAIRRVLMHIMSVTMVFGVRPYIGTRDLSCLNFESKLNQHVMNFIMFKMIIMCLFPLYQMSEKSLISKPANKFSIHLLLDLPHNFFISEETY